MALRFEPQTEVSASKEIFDYACAIVSGAVSGTYKGIEGVLNAIVHPLDEVIYPISELLYDSTIIASAHSEDNPDMIILKQLITNNPKIYFDARQRMQGRIDGLKTLGEVFVNASGPKKIEMLTETLTMILAPGYILKGAKTISNLNHIGIPYNPPKFHPYDGATSLHPTAIKKLAIDEVRNKYPDEVLMYVITDDKRLVITAQEYDHWHLSQGKPVYTAGDIYMENGKLIRVDNRSGSFSPQGEHLRKFTETIFRDNDFPEATGKFIDFAKEIGSTYIPIISRDNPSLYPFSAAAVIVLSKASKTESKAEQSRMHFRRGCDLFENKQAYQAALRETNEAIRLDPQLADAYNLRGSCYQATNRLQEAMVSFDESIKLLKKDNPKACWFYYNRALAHKQLNNYEKALADINKFLESDPGHSGGVSLRNEMQKQKQAQEHCAKALDLFYKKDYKGSLIKIDEAIRLDPQLADAYNLRGSCYQATNRLQEAMVSFDESIKLLKKDNPKACWFYYNRALAHKQLNNYEKALADINKFLESDPGHSGGVSLRNEMQKQKQAQEHCAKALDLFYKKDYKGSLIKIDEAIRLDPQLADAYNLRGSCYQATNRLQEAMVSFDESIKLLKKDNPKACWFYYNRALAHKQLNNYEKALADINKFLESDPGHSGGVSLRNEMRNKIKPVDLAISFFDIFGLTPDPPAPPPERRWIPYDSFEESRNSMNAWIASQQQRQQERDQAFISSLRVFNQSIAKSTQQTGQWAQQQKEMHERERATSLKIMEKAAYLQKREIESRTVSQPLTAGSSGMYKSTSGGADSSPCMFKPRPDSTITVKPLPPLQIRTETSCYQPIQDSRIPGPNNYCPAGWRPSSIPGLCEIRGECPNNFITVRSGK